MEVDPPPVPPPDATESTLWQKLQAGDWEGALDAAETAELIVQTHRWGQDKGDPATVLAIELALHFIVRDLDNARHMWRRLDPAFKAAQGSRVAQLWEVGKRLWTRDIPGAYAALAAVEWPPDIAPLVAALTARIRQDELELIRRAYKRIRLPTLAAKLGMDVQEAAAAAASAGWRVDQGEGVVEPSTKRTQAEETIGIQQLNQLATYVKFLEQKSATSA